MSDWRGRVLVAGILVWSVVGKAYVKRYLPLTDTEVSRRIVQTRIAVNVEPGEKARLFGSVRVELVGDPDSTLLVTGGLGTGRHPVEDDLSDDAPVRTGKLKEVHWANTRQSENPEIVMSDGSICRAVAWYSTMTVILDSKEGRQAASLESPDEARKFLEKIRDEGLRVELFGKRRYPVAADAPRRAADCVPETIWAKEPE